MVPGSVADAIAGRLTYFGFVDVPVVTNGQALYNDKYDAGWDILYRPFLTVSIPATVDCSRSGCITAAQTIWLGALVSGISSKLGLFLLHKKQSLVGSNPSNLAARLNFAAGCGTSSNFVEQIGCGYRSLETNFRNSTAPYFFRIGPGWNGGPVMRGSSAAIQSIDFEGDTAPGQPPFLTPVGFLMRTRSTRTWFVYTNRIQEVERYDGIWNYLAFPDGGPTCGR